MDGRQVSIVVTPGAASVRYTTDASSPRAAGKDYSGPFSIPADQDILVRVIAVDGDIEKEETKQFDRRATGFRERPDPGPVQPRIPTVREYVDERRPAVLKGPGLAWTATKATYEALDALQAASAQAVAKRMTIGENDRAITMALGSDMSLTAEHLRGLLGAARTALALEEVAATMSLKSVSFPTGAELIAFLESTRIDIGDPRETIFQGEAA